jgi:uncharacterized repeat protein (TIGR03943 family)
MRRDTQNVLLVLLGGALLKMACTDLYLRYVKPGNRWYLLTAGAVILVLAGAGLLRDARTARGDRHGEHRPGGHRNGEHGHGHREPHSPWLLLLPVLAVFLVAPPALGADSVLRSAAGNSVSVAADGSEQSFPPLPPGGAPELGMSDFVARAVWESGGALSGREVTLTGFVVRRPGGGTELARLVITCCAADARPMVVRLVGAPDAPSGTWLQVRARLIPGSATLADRYTPVAQVLDAVTVPEPAEAYEY